MTEPGWHDRPTEPGTWLYDPDFGVKQVWHVDAKSVTEPEWYLPCGGQWFGPIEPKPRVKPACSGTKSRMRTG